MELSLGVVFIASEQYSILHTTVLLEHGDETWGIEYDDDREKHQRFHLCILLYCILRNHLSEVSSA